MICFLKQTLSPKKKNKTNMENWKPNSICPFLFVIYLGYYEYKAYWCAVMLFFFFCYGSPKCPRSVLKTLSLLSSA